MCTVTVLRADGLVRLAANRDEMRSRPAAMPPRVQQFGSRRALLPTDPVGGGTWIAVNDAGLALTVLNVTARPRNETAQARANPPHSRGAIIPGLVDAGDLSAAVESALRLDPTDYAPFRLVLVDDGFVAELRSDGQHLGLVRRSGLTTPRLFTSSGLGDGLVEGPRGELFARYFDAAGDLLAEQDAYHRHAWPGRPHLSVCMRRADARTVSHTVVTVKPDHVGLVYHADAPDRPAERFTLSLARRGGGR